MSFSFGFSGNDYEDVEDTNQSNIQAITSDNGKFLINPLDSQHLLNDPVIQPQIEEYEINLKSLQNVRLSFEQFMTPETNSILFRRELFDIKHQLMSENNSSAENELDILINEDLKKNVYEGGLKSWECSIDVVDTLVKKSKYTSILPQLNLNDIRYVVELGCGTALPTEYIFAQYISQNSNQGIHFILADYNSSVLRLASLPNLIITWAKLTLTQDQWSNLQRCNDENIPIVNDELLLTEQLIDSFYQDMKQRNIQLSLISGSWGRKFNTLLYSLMSNVNNDQVLVITSETIYQPENLPLISETLIDINNHFNNNSHTLVAAKDIYFGVGGSILDFQDYLTRRNINFNIFKVNAGLKRSIVYI